MEVTKQCFSLIPYIVRNLWRFRRRLVGNAPFYTTLSQNSCVVVLLPVTPYPRSLPNLIEVKQKAPEKYVRTLQCCSYFRLPSRKVPFAENFNCELWARTTNLLRSPGIQAYVESFNSTDDDYVNVSRELQRALLLQKLSWLFGTQSSLFSGSVCSNLR